MEFYVFLGSLSYEMLVIVGLSEVLELFHLDHKIMYSFMRL